MVPKGWWRYTHHRRSTELFSHLFNGKRIGRFFEYPRPVRSPDLNPTLHSFYITIVKSVFFVSDGIQTHTLCLVFNVEEISKNRLMYIQGLYRLGSRGTGYENLKIWFSVGILHNTVFNFLLSYVIYKYSGRGV